MPTPGEIWLDTDFLGDKTKQKYLLVLAVSQGDVTYRCLTSQQHGRPEDPACYHGNPYQGFYLGILGGPLIKKSWLDLSLTEDLDAVAFGRMEKANQLVYIMLLDDALLCPALRCTANAPYTDRVQARRIADVVQARGCP